MTRSRFVPGLCVLALGFSSLVSAQSHAPSRPPHLVASPQGEPAACGPTTLTQSSSQAITADNSNYCHDANGHHFDNSYWRKFRLSDSGINGAFGICSVEVGIQTATAGAAGVQPIEVRLYTGDDFPSGTLTPIGAATVFIGDMSLTVLPIPISATASAGSTLVVEIFTPDGTLPEDLNTLIVGSNASLQTGISYFSADECDVIVPTDLADVGYPDMHLVINVIGQEFIATPVAVSVDETGAGNQNGVMEIGETATIAPTWSNGTNAAYSLLGLVSHFGGASGPFYIVDDGTADYGLVPANGSANCASATGDCFAVHIAGPRPAQHFDASLTEQLDPSPTSAPTAGLPDKVWTLHVGGSFTDVPTDNQFYKDIETIFHKGVTGGCGAGTDYCPDGTTLRKQMAVFLLKADQGSSYVPPPATGIFDDVPADAFQPWIEDLYNRGITGGCAGGPPPAPISYCPDQDVKRKQMAVFLLKASQGSSYVPPAATGIFDDVPADVFQPWIEDLYNRGITGGCSGGPPPAPIQYCPENPVTRGQMAVFVTKSFGLLLYGP